MNLMFLLPITVVILFFLTLFVLGLAIAVLVGIISFIGEIVKAIWEKYKHGRGQR